ncbi:hypothetical protein [Dietzia kunjamensis]|uniref:hypothetical protein n=1 Tax=Dietzia kunjamensis TaxID=322509 RepID=UPI003890D2E6
MSEHRSRRRAAMAVTGILLLIATVALAIGSVRATEASWNDTAVGAARFAAKNPYADTRFARAVSTFGSMDRAILDNNVGPVTAFRQSPDTTRNAVSDTHDSASFGVLHLNTVGGSCTALDPAREACPSAGGAVTTPTAQAVSETRSLDLTTGRLSGLDLVTYRGSAPIRATATCSPTQATAALTSDGPIVLGRSGIFEQEVRVALPAANAETTATRSWGSYDYTATLQHVRKESPGYALSQLRLRVVSSSGNDGRWTLTMILAHAECGVNREITTAPTRPTTGDWPALATAPSPMDLTRTAPSAATTTAGTTTAATASTATSPAAAADASASPITPSATAVPETTPITETPSANSRTTTSELSAPTTTSVQPATEPTPTTPATTTRATSSEQATTEHTTPAVAEGPQEPQAVRVGREFAVVNRDGVELGAAKLEKIVRTPGCGVELTLTITTSAETGPDRWAAISPEDLAEVRPGGATRDAERVGSDCPQSATSTSTRLSPGSEHRIVVSALIGDSAEQVMLRPAGTAGWIVDLPALEAAAPQTAEA